MFFWAAIFGITGVAGLQIQYKWIEIFFLLLIFEIAGVAGLQFKYKGNIFWVTIFGIAGVAESQDCRFSMNEFKYIFF